MCTCVRIYRQCHSSLFTVTIEYHVISVTSGHSKMVPVQPQLSHHRTEINVVLTEQLYNKKKKLHLKLLHKYFKRFAPVSERQS